MFEQIVGAIVVILITGGGATWLSSKISEERISQIRCELEKKVDIDLFIAEKDNSRGIFAEIKSDIKLVFSKLDEIKNMMIKKE
jgi:predicted RNA-binding protein with PIN domain